MPKKFYITTPIYYVNDVPHIGHAYTTVAADVLSRYYKQTGRQVFFLTGTDEHGAKIAEAAEKAGLKPKEFVDTLIPKFQTAWENLNIEYSEFFRTTDPKHEAVVADFVQKLQEKGFVEKRKYSGLYCVGCERYLLPDELVDGKCPDHNTTPKEQSEENYFFLLSKFSDKLLNVIESDTFEILPASRKNEVLGKIKQGLEDVSISREKVEWGIPFPGDESQTIYVWIDALINYWSATKIYSFDCHPELDSGSQDSSASPQNDINCIWPADVHLMAKDILWFHAIIWPALLMALDIPLPKRVFAHGFFTVDGKKMSKTLGNVLDPNKLVEKFGADAVRYALLREFPFGEDGDISEEKIAIRYQNDLGNGLGNLVQRTLSMINKYNVKVESEKLKVKSDVVIPAEAGIQNSQIPDQVRNDRQGDKISNLIKDLKFDQALQEIWKEIANLNSYIDENKPWELAKSDPTKLSEVLNYVYQNLQNIVPQISPFMPETAEKMANQLETLKPEVLFPRINE